MPQAAVPKTASRRRRRNNRLFRVSAAALKRVVFSARWISLALLALCVYALVLIGLDTNFYLTLIPVEGTTSIPPAEIVEASGLAGAHIFAADPNRAAARIDELPGVISAMVTLRWPNDVLIRIEEDSPVAIWKEAEEEYWITGDGALVPSRVETVGLLTIESELPLVGADGQEASPTAVDEDEVTAESERRTSLAFVPQAVLAGGLQLRELRPNIQRLYYRPSGGLSYEDGRGWRVYFGEGTDMHQKVVIYETIVEDLLARELTPAYISVSNKEKPFYMIR